MFALTVSLNREEFKTRTLSVPSYSEGGGKKKQFDCLDFCQWSLGENYSFEDYIVPNCTVGVPFFEDLIDHEDQ